jgi:hypothetical protein
MTKMKSPAKYTKYLVLLISTLLLLAPFLAIGRLFRMDLLPDKGRNFSCGTCHVNAAGGGARNPFGKDWEAIAIPRGDKYVPDIANRDSDGDGFTNDQEFNAGKHPGDPNSKPDKPKAVKPRGKSFTLWGKIRSDDRR